MVRRLIAIAVLALVAFAASVPMAAADTGDIIAKQNDPATDEDGFQAATCIEDEPLPEPTVFCSPETPLRFFKQAGGHPPMGFTQYIIQHKVTVPGKLEPLVEPIEGRAIKTLRVDLPPGLTVNPEATPERCTLVDFEKVTEVKPGVFIKTPACKPGTVVGREEVTLVTNDPNVEVAPGVILPNEGSVIPPSKASGTNVDVFNLVPDEGEPAKFGFVVAFREPVFLTTDVSWESDYHEAFTIKRPPPKIPGVSTLKSRLVSKGEAGDGTFITNPTTCFTGEEFPHIYSTWFRAESHETPNPTFPTGSTPFEAPFEPLEGCELVPFTPALAVDPGTGDVDSPAPATVTTTVPWEVPSGGEKEIAQSHLRRAVATLPKGMGINPSGANGLEACLDSQFGKGTRNLDNSCPAASDIGTAEVETPPLDRKSVV